MTRPIILLGLILTHLDSFRTLWTHLISDQGSAWTGFSFCILTCQSQFSYVSEPSVNAHWRYHFYVEQLGLLKTPSKMAFLAGFEQSKGI